MIISPQRNFIFIHLYKCGGTSVERAYEKISLWDDLILGSTDFGEYAQGYYKQKFDLHKHSVARNVIRALGKERYLSMESFALVRNPFRVYESLHGWIEGFFISHVGEERVENLKRRIRCNEVDRPFANWPASQAYAHSEDFRGFMDYFEVHGLPFEPMCRSLMMANDRCRVKHVYKLEEIDAFWRHLAEITGAPLEPLHENRSAREDYVWEARQIESIRRAYAEDFERFGYELE
jgi:hypothetical protein